MQLVDLCSQELGGQYIAVLQGVLVKKVEHQQLLLDSGEGDALEQTPAVDLVKSLVVLVRLLQGQRQVVHGVFGHLRVPKLVGGVVEFVGQRLASDQVDVEFIDVALQLQGGDPLERRRFVLVDHHVLVFDLVDGFLLGAAEKEEEEGEE